MSKAEELAQRLEEITADTELSQRYCDSMIEAAEELRRLAALEQAAEPAMIYHGRCTIDCGEHGHQDVEMLKMIPAGSKLYTHPAPRKPMTDEQALAIVKAAPALDTAEQEWLHVIRQVERFHQIKE